MGLFGKKPERAKKSVELDERLFKRINSLLGALPGEEPSTAGIAYFKSSSSEKQFIQIVGESFCQEDIKSHFKPEQWNYGLLVPEQSNKVDSNAVALYLITKEFSVVKVGYLNKDLAKKTSQKIVNLIANEDLVIPVLAIVKKNKDESGALGVVAYAMTDSLRFL
jgi:hypothetical protein